MKLVVINPFDIYSRGDEIDDPAIIADILSGDYSIHVVKVVLPQ